MDREARRRHVLMDQFKDLLNHMDDSCAVRGPSVCPAGPCGGGGGGAGYGQRAPSHPEYTTPVSTFNPPRLPDYKDPARRPLITFPDSEVQSQNAFIFSNGSNNKSPLCPVMDPRCPASFAPGAVGGGNGYGAGGGYAPCANGGMGMGMGMDMGMGSQCPATAYAGGGGGRSARASPCMAAILERERQERERQEREIRERMERERIERERKELERRERDLKAREPYMCPGQAQLEKAALKEAKKAHLAGKPLDQGGRGGNGYNGFSRDTRQCSAQGNGNHGYKQSPEERFGPCVPVADLAPCDPRACPASSGNHIPLQETKSRELHGGVLYTGCDCNRRNGLQHDCKRTLCQGRPECLTKPDPMCIPSGGPGYISPCYPVCDPQCWE